MARPYFREKKKVFGKIVQWIIRPDDLNLMPRAYMVEGENVLPQVIL